MAKLLKKEEESKYFRNFANKLAKLLNLGIKNKFICFVLRSIFRNFARNITNIINMKSFRSKPWILPPLGQRTLARLQETALMNITLSIVLVTLLLCSCGSKGTNDSQSKITADMAFEGVNNYCHKEYDWSVAKDNPDIMYVQMDEETDSTYQVVFRSYTGAFVHFYVNKTSGTTRMVEKVPSLNVEEDAGTFELFDYLEEQK